MKPVVFYARTLFEVALLIIRLREVAKQAIKTTGAVRITVEPATPAEVETKSPKRSRPPMGALAAARSLCS